jgi:hypothetical protein
LVEQQRGTNGGEERFCNVQTLGAAAVRFPPADERQDDVRHAMMIRWIVGAIAVWMAGSAAFAQTFDVRVGKRVVHATARLATQGLGYSVLQDRGPQEYHPVQVTCINGAFSRVLCPTPRYDAFCPDGRIVCR